MSQPRAVRRSAACCSCGSGGASATANLPSTCVWACSVSQVALQSEYASSGHSVAIHARIRSGNEPRLEAHRPLSRRSSCWGHHARACGCREPRHRAARIRPRSTSRSATPPRAAGQHEDIARARIPRRAAREWVTALGNHDILHNDRTVADWGRAYGQRSQNFTVEIDFVRLVVIGPDRNEPGRRAGRLSSATLSFLERELAGTDKDCWVVCHWPLLRTVMGNPALYISRRRWRRSTPSRIRASASYSRAIETRSSGCPATRIRR